MTSNKKGLDLLDRVNKEWKKSKDKDVVECGYDEKGDHSHWKISGMSTGQQPHSKTKFERRRQKGYMQKMGSWDAVDACAMEPTPEQIAKKIQRDLKQAKIDAKKYERRHRGGFAKTKKGTQTLKEVKAERDKYKEGFLIVCRWIDRNSKYEKGISFMDGKEIQVPQRLEKRLRAKKLVTMTRDHNE